MPDELEACSQKRLCFLDLLAGSRIRLKTVLSIAVDCADDYQVSNAVTNWFVQVEDFPFKDEALEIKDDSHQ